MVKAPKEMIQSAKKIVYKSVDIDTTILNIRLRIRKYGIEQINTMMESLCIPLRDLVKGYQYIYHHLHPFERVVTDLTITTYSKQNNTMNLITI